MVDTPNKKFPLMASNQSQKHVTYNEMLIDMDIIVQSSVISASVVTPPGSPTEGDTYIIPASATGAWSGHEDKITMWHGGAWVMQTPQVGWRCWDQETSELLVFDGSAWTSLLDSMLSAGVLDTVFTLNDNVDTTKKLRFELSGITTNTTRILTVPDANGTIALLDASQTFTTTTTFAGATVDVGTATGDSTYGLGTGATTTGQTKTINIGTSGDSGSTTIVNIGSTNTGALGSTIINSPTVTFAASVAEIGASAANISALYLGLGGATADSNNRFSINSPQVLLNNAGAGHQLKINKAAAGDTASLLFQTGFSGRAEMGTAGSDNFAIKVSADGSNWNTALTADAGTGALTLGAPLGVGSGGTGGTTAAAARGNLGLGTAAIQDVTTSPDARVAGRLLKVGDSARLLKWTPNVVLRNYVADATWLSSTSAANNNWWSVCWSPELGLFCAVANNGTGNRVMTSPDGINWTTQTSAADNVWYSVCWSPELGLFCAVSITGTGDRVMTSPDGITWTARASAADNQWTSVCWSPELGLFCAVANTGANRVMTSPDGITWTSINSQSKDWFSVCWSPELGLFCAVARTSSGDRVMTSPDGINWTLRTPAAQNGWLSVCWSPELGLFCAVALTGTGDRVMTSPDGVNWTARTTPQTTNGIPSAGHQNSGCSAPFPEPAPVIG